MTNEDAFDLISDCTDRQEKLTDWEVDFLSSIEDQIDGGRRLSARQVETLENIWEKVT